MIKKLEVLANIAVIATSVVLCSVLVKKYFFTAKQTVAAAPSTPSIAANVPKKTALQSGAKISLPGIDWSQKNHTLVLALSTTCHFCTESATFYQKLQEKTPNDTQIVAVLPQSIEDGRNYLKKLGVSVNDVVQAPLGSVGVSGTPTVLLIDRHGIVKDSWVGKLADEQAAKVMAALTAGAGQ